jgi:nicotinamide riboside kinase
MLVTYMGAPCSSKTTTSARLFADLKERGMAVEYLTEYAREFISSRRHFEGGVFAGLNDLDQAAILREQARREEVMTFDPKVVVIADSCAMSALLYMTDAYIEKVLSMPSANFYGGQSPIDLAREQAKKYDVIFRCAPVRPGVGYDPNRIHSYEQSLELDKRMERVFDLCNVDRSKVFPLFGDTKLRVSESSAVLMPRLIERLMTK